MMSSKDEVRLAVSMGVLTERLHAENALPLVLVADATDGGVRLIMNAQPGMRQEEVLAILDDAATGLRKQIKEG